MAIQIADLKKTTEQKMDKTIQAFKADLGKVRTGRAHTGLLDHIHVDYYGTPTPLNQVAKVTLLGQPFVKDDKQTVEKMLGAKKAKVNAYAFLVVGEGIEKKASDFAAEVMAQAGKAH